MVAAPTVRHQSEPMNSGPVSSPTYASMRLAPPSPVRHDRQVVNGKPGGPSHNGHRALESGGTSARPEYHVNSSRRAHHASAASIAVSAAGTLSIIQAVATQCRGIWVIIAGRNRRSSGVTGSGAELS